MRSTAAITSLRAAVSFFCLTAMLLKVMPRTRAKRSRQQVRQCKEPSLRAFQHEQVLDRLVRLPILRIAQAIAVLAFEKDARERVQKVDVLRRRRHEIERVDGDALLPEPEFQISAVQQPRELPIAVSQVEHHGQRVNSRGIAPVA